ncbi:MAG: class I SAM-dependent RNA methyltransferase, partial [Flavobacteriaceae bacterium]|nr:class I SAM-dependent RNA methyltransferase [Flavobacteriaceae bacterium]
AWMISSNMEALKHVGLRPSRKIKLFNGKLESRLLLYPIYEGTKRIHKLKED